MGDFFQLLNQTLNSLGSKKLMKCYTLFMNHKNLVALSAVSSIGGFGGAMVFQVWPIPAHTWETLRASLQVQWVR